MLLCALLLLTGTAAWAEEISVPTFAQVEAEAAAYVAQETAALMAAAPEIPQYDYDAVPYLPDTKNYPGVYVTQPLVPNGLEAANAKTIGFPEIADQNLTEPTTKSPAIIQGAAVGYEERLGPTDYKTIKDRIEPYTDFMFKIIEEAVTDASGNTTVHKKPSGFDGTYIIARLDVSNFLPTGPSNLWLHVKQEQNKALMAAATTAALKEGEHEFTDGLGTRTGSYNASNLKDSNGEKLYYDVILYSTGKLAAGADAGKAGAGNGDVPIQMYVDDIPDYNPSLNFDPASTDPNHAQKVLAKFFDLAESKKQSKIADEDKKYSSFKMMGSDLALEVAVENSGGENKDTGTTYWSLAKALEDSYYDLPQDSSPSDTGSGRTVKMISEVPVTEQINLEGTDANHLKKRTLDLNSYDIQIAKNSTTDKSTYSDGFLIKNAWLTIADKSNTTGAELAIGNNAHFIIDQGGKLIIDETCQLEIEWDGATTTPGTTTTTPDILNNGILDLRAGGEIVNNGIITIEGTEGKPAAPGTTAEQASNSEKGFGEMTIDQGATLTNNGSLVVYGKLYNLGTLVNNGKYSDTIKQNDPDKGTFEYHKGIQVSWKDDVTQNNVQPGVLFNGKDRDGNIVSEAQLINNGDIVLAPGSIENYSTLKNADGSTIYVAAATEAIIPIEQAANTNKDPNAPPPPTTKRITVDPPKGSSIENYGTIVNDGRIVPASVAIEDKGNFGVITVPGKHPELFTINNHGTITNNGYIFGDKVTIEFSSGSGTFVMFDPIGMIESTNGTWLYLYADKTFVILLPDGTKLSGTIRFDGDVLIFVLEDGSEIVPTRDADGTYRYSYTSASGFELRFTLDTDTAAQFREQFEKNTFPVRAVMAID